MKHVFRFNAMKHSRNEHQQFWTHGNHAAVYCEPTKPEIIQSKIHYIHENPVRAGWVYSAEHCLYSSARNYAGLNGLVKIVL